MRSTPQKGDLSGSKVARFAVIRSGHGFELSPCCISSSTFRHDEHARRPPPVSARVDRVGPSQPSAARPALERPDATNGRSDLGAVAG